MNPVDYLIPVNRGVNEQGSFGSDIILYGGEPYFELPESTKVAILGVPEDRFSDGAGEIKSPEKIRKQLYALSAGSPGTVVDLGNLRTGKTLADTYFGLRHILSELYEHNIVTLLIGGTSDVFYGNYLAFENRKVTVTTVSPRLRFFDGAEKHPFNALTFDRGDLPVYMCNIGYQSYYVSRKDLEFFRTEHLEAYRLGEVRAGNICESEPVIRDSDLLSISMNAVKYSDAPGASNASPNGFSGEEICQISHYAGLSHRCRSVGIFDMVPQNDLRDITAKLAAQVVWYFIEGVKRRNVDNPRDAVQNFKKYVIYFDQLHHNLCFYKNIKTERWWMEVPSLNNDRESEIISCTRDDYAKASEQEIPDRWWKMYQRIN